MPKSELVDLELHWHRETDAAIHVSENGDNSKAVWLPKSQIEFVRNADEVEVTLPQWLAKDKGLV